MGWRAGEHHDAAPDRRFRVPGGARPRLGLVVVTCMDARVDPAELLGIPPGGAHILRNAGGVVTDDVLQSIAVSQRRLGTDRVTVLHHTDCAGRAERLPGRDVMECVRLQMRRLRESPLLEHRERIRGVAFFLADGTLREVGPAAHPATQARSAGGGRRAEAREAPEAAHSALSHCLACGRGFVRRPGLFRRADYCGDLCRQAARAGHIGPAG